VTALDHQPMKYRRISVGTLSVVCLGGCAQIHLFGLQPN
jgi:hypothetical protein